MENKNNTENSENIEQLETVNSRKILGLCPVFLLLLIIVLRVSWTLYRSFGQKTRSPQQRRMYGGSRPRQSLAIPEPTIYVSPSNLPPPPKYEFMAPPSYEEVVGIHYPSYGAQPIAQPINNALAHGSAHSPPDYNASNVNNATDSNNAPASITVTSEARRMSETVRT